MNKLPLHTPDLTEQNYKALASLFPNAVTETKDENGQVVRSVDADVLAQEINTHVVSGREERYQFTWPDKKKAVLLANSPIAATLRPCREESVDFDNTENLYIEGDNLDVLKLLRETYLNRVKMIYIDPPYNTGNDFIYPDKYSIDSDQWSEMSGDYDDQGNRLVPNLDSNGRFHTNWLNMIYPRLRVARDLLTDDGAIFISIDDNEIENLKKICNEIFGSENFVAQFAWEKRYTRNNDAKLCATVIDYIIAYRKSAVLEILREPRSERNNSSYSNPDNDPRGIWTSVSVVSQRTREERPNLCYEIINPITNRVVSHPTNAWKYSYPVYKRLCDENRLYWGENGGNQYPRLKRFLSEVGNGIVPTNYWSYKETGTLDDGTKEVEALIGRAIFTYPKPVSLLIRLLKMTTQDSKDAIILDFFSGSATTAHAVMQLNAEDGGNRKFIMVQIQEPCAEDSEAAKAGFKNICEIGKERIRRAGKKIVTSYKEKEPGASNLVINNSKLVTNNSELKTDVGFRVLKLASSNMKDVYYKPQDTIAENGELQVDLDRLIDNIKHDRTPEDLLFQVMLDLGILLSSKIEKRKIGGKTVFFVADNYLVACFEHITDETITEIAKSKPYYAVFQDSNFDSDATLVNFEQIFRTYSPATIRKVL